MSIPVTIFVPAGTMEGCFKVDVVDDNVNEPQESFQVTASLPGSATPDATTDVIITDDDGKCFHFPTSLSQILH